MVLLFLAMALPVFSNSMPVEPIEEYEVNLSTPYHTVLTHLHFLQNATYEPEKQRLPFYIPKPTAYGRAIWPLCSNKPGMDVGTW